MTKVTNQRMKVGTVLALAGLGATASLAFLYIWLTRDSSMPDDSALAAKLEESDEALRPRHQELCRTYANLTLQDGTAASQHLEQTGASVPPERVRPLFSNDAMRDLPTRIESILASGYVPRSSSPDLVCIRNLSDLLQRLLEHQLAESNRPDALHTALLSLRFSRLLHDTSRTAADLAIARHAQTQAVRSIVAGIDNAQLGPRELQELTHVEPPQETGRRVVDMIQDTYRGLDRTSQARSEDYGLMRPVVYHPNRSKAWWVEHVAPQIPLLERGDLLGAYRKLSELPEPPLPHLRNQVGQQVYLSMVGVMVENLARSFDFPAQVDLLRIRAAIALYQQKHGQLPPTLDVLSDFLNPIPLDPWSGSTFVYAPISKLLYSVGSNQRDDQGRFQSNFSSDQNASDYGIKL